jgi:ankyrin repeat protein
MKVMPLHSATAARIGDKEMVAVLLQNGADCQVRNKDRKTPAEMARTNGHEEIANLLL